MPKQWVIPDIHGNARTLKALILEQIRPSKHDWLYFLGDYIDRGPDSKAVIDFIMKLQEEEYSVRLLIGNHEDYLLRTYNNEYVEKKFFGLRVKNKLKNEWMKFGGKETLQSFGIREVSQIPEKYITWLKSLELYIELEKYYLVHAGLNFELNDPFDDKHSMLWIKEFKIKPEKIHHKKIIHGHVPVSLEFIDLVTKTDTFDFIDLDNGAYMVGKEGFGNLIAFEINSKELIIQPNLDAG